MKNSITKKTFDDCHTLVDTANLSCTKAAQILGLSISAVSRVVKCSTYEEYVEAARNGYAPLSKANKEARNSVTNQTTVTIQANHYMMEELRKTNEYLRLISNKLAYIVEELTGKSEDGGQQT